MKNNIILGILFLLSMLIGCRNSEELLQSSSSSENNPLVVSEGETKVPGQDACIDYFESNILTFESAVNTLKSDEIPTDCFFYVKDEDILMYASPERNGEHQFATNCFPNFNFSDILSLLTDISQDQNYVNIISKDVGADANGTVTEYIFSFPEVQGPNNGAMCTRAIMYAEDASFPYTSHQELENNWYYVSHDLA